MPIDDAQFVRIAKAIADPTRVRVLRAIQAGEGCSCADLAGVAGVSKATLSHHLKTLEEAGLITVRKEGQFHRLKADARTLRAFASAAAPKAARPRPRKPRS